LNAHRPFAANPFKRAQRRRADAGVNVAVGHRDQAIDGTVADHDQSGNRRFAPRLVVRGEIGD
jgi:hypothetical protein